MCDSGIDETKVKCVQLLLDGSPGYVVPIDQAWDWIKEELAILEDGSVLGLKVKEMTQHQLDNLKEFEGW